MTEGATAPVRSGAPQNRAVEPVEVRYSWRARPVGQVAEVAAVLQDRIVRDPRVRYVDSGVGLALPWVLGHGQETPVGGLAVSEPGVAPGFSEIVGEYVRAVLVSGGVQHMDGFDASDSARLIARGIEAFLLWYAFPSVPACGLLDPHASPAEVLAPLGKVGRGPEGLHGPGVSRIRFPDLPGSLARVDDEGKLVTSIS